MTYNDYDVIPATIYVVDLSTDQVVRALDGQYPTQVAGGVIAFWSYGPLLSDDTNLKDDIYVAAVSAPPGAPPPPTNLAYSLTNSRLTLTWQPPGGGVSVSEYVIGAGTRPGGFNIANFSTGSTETSFSAPVSGGGTYYIRVGAANAAGVSDPSNEVAVSLAALPAAPSSLLASVAGSTVTLSWSGPASSAVTTYVIEAGSSPGASNLANFATNSTETAFTANGVGAGTYYVRIRAANFGGVGPPSNEVLVVVTGGCVAPTAPTNLAASVSGSTVALTWSASTAASTYVIDVGSAPGQSNILVADLGSSATSLVATNVAAATYFVRLRASNACGTSGPSNEAVVVVR